MAVIRGLAFPFARSTTSFPATVSDEDAIEQNIRRILETPRGSRVMRMDVGSNIYQFVFDPIGPVMKARINQEVRRAIAEGEPRASVVSVEAFEEKQPNGDRYVIVTVSYEANLLPGSVTSSFRG